MFPPQRPKLVRAWTKYRKIQFAGQNGGPHNGPAKFNDMTTKVRDGSALTDKIVDDQATSPRHDDAVK